MKTNEVEITHVHIGLWNATVLLVTLAIAAIPAAIIIAVLWLLVGGMFAAFLAA